MIPAQYRAKTKSAPFLKKSALNRSKGSAASLASLLINELIYVHRSPCQSTGPLKRSQYCRERVALDCRLDV
jgi:hypothetical protein